MKWLSIEDAILKQYASRKTAAEIGEILGRTPGAVYHRAKRIGIALIKRGEAHWNTVVSDVQRLAVSILHDNGMTPEQCYMLITGSSSITKATIDKICKG